MHTGTGANPRMEAGSKDWRMVPIGISMWAGMLLAHGCFGSWTTGEPAFTAPQAWLILVCLGLLVLLVLVLSRCEERGLPGRCWSFCSSLVRGLRPSLLLMLLTILLGALASLSTDLMQSRDPAMVHASQGGASIQARLRLTSPVTASSMRQALCQADGSLESITREGRQVTSHSPVRLLLTDQRACSTLLAGSHIQLSGQLRLAPVGRLPLWLTGQDGHIEVLAQAPWIKRVVHASWRSFFQVTDRLSDQGRVLVPGLTVGLLGQDYLGQPATADSEGSKDAGKPIKGLTESAGLWERQPVNQTYASMLTTHFRQAGIMHLMAVSGGHFALLASLIRRLCARLLLPRQLVALAVTASYCALALMVYPSDSVLRALVMGLIGACGMWRGRPSQLVSSLAWTSMGVLLVNPAMSRSYGFALSVAAVLGIGTMARPIARGLSAHLPKVLAEMMAMTLSAQAFTLPIQVLMQPQLPLLSLPANMLVAPFVDFSTLTGLAALLLATWNQTLAYALAWLSSAGTLVMERTAQSLGSQTSFLIPWAGGAGGALLMLLLEIAIMASFHIVHLLWQQGRRRAGEAAGLGQPHRLTMMARLRFWWSDTRRIFGHWSRPGPGRQTQEEGKEP
ncbi:ComEC/Rec2 family competence protein [Bifidobacterium aemilianum]|nr:ComEC/Rec2 family competence protein [Bifidobacterium aemilianum]